MRKPKTKQEVEEWNGKVQYNETVGSIIIDIIACLIAWPMIIIVIHRRIKYKKYYDETDL